MRLTPPFLEQSFKSRDYSPSPIIDGTTNGVRPEAEVRTISDAPHLMFRQAVHLGGPGHRLPIVFQLPGDFGSPCAFSR